MLLEQVVLQKLMTIVVDVLFQVLVAMVERMVHQVVMVQTHQKVVN